MRRAFISLIVLFVALRTRATAQAAPPIDTRNAIMHGEFIVKTVPLHHLSSIEAVRLLAPYSATAGGG